MDEIDLDVFNQRLSLRNEETGTMEQKLKALLLQNPYTLEEAMGFEGDDEMGSEGEEEMGLEGGQESGLHQWNDLKSMLHATNEELKSALRLVSAVKINGHWRIVDDSCIGQVLYCLVWRAKSMNWSLSSLDGDKVLRICACGFSLVLVQHCLELYASPKDERVWELDTKRVSVELARWVIKSNGKRMEIQKFMDHWSYIGLPVSLDMLDGEILVEKHGNQAWVYIPSDHDGPNGNTLTSAFQAFSLDSPNANRLSLRNEDAGTMELKLKTLLLQNPYTLDEERGCEACQPSRLHKWDDLKSMLHATDEELTSLLGLFQP